MLGDNLFNKIEKKTNVDKNTILKLAQKLQNKDIKDETTIKEIIKDLSNITGKEVSKEKEEKIINAIMKDQVPKNIDKMF